jgi:FAD/FMN-containing dehydrogenase
VSLRPNWKTRQLGRLAWFGWRHGNKGEISIDLHTELQSQVSGRVLAPDDATYDTLRRGWNLIIDQYPTLILVAETVQDVVTGVRFAHSAGLSIAVQSTGHGILEPANNSLLIVTSQMNTVQANIQARTARVDAGVIWKQVLGATTPHGLAPLLGSSIYVGVVGYTLGGGIGWLARKYGLAADSVRWIEVVTADGDLRHVSLTEDSDLFWGMRGGGGNFGVVTALEFDLHPVPVVYGGNLVYPAALAGEALRFYRDWVETVPDELTSSFVILKYPALPHLPAVLRGKTVVLVRAAFVGEATEGAAWMRAWLDWQPPLINELGEIPFARIGTISKDPAFPTPIYGSSEMFDSLSDAAIDVIVRYATDEAAPLPFCELRHAGGAIARGDPNTNAICHRDATFYMQLGGLAPTPEARAAMDAYMQEFKHDLRSYLRGGVYLNFLAGDEARDRVRDAYTPATYERLLALKQKYDPMNLFRFSYPLVVPSRG